MRILIADDSSPLPQLWTEALAKAVAAAPLTKSAKKAAKSAEAVSLLCAANSSSDQAPALELANQPEQLGAILDALGIALLNRGFVAEGRKLIVLALDIRREFFGNSHPAVAASLTSLARVHRMEGNLIAGAKTADDALKMNRRFFGHSGLPLVATYVEAGVLHLYAGDSGQAGKAALKGLAILKKHGLTATDPNTSRLLDTLGRALELRGRALPEKKARPLFKAALAALTKAVHLDLKQVGCDHPKYGTHRANQASAQWALGDLVGAEAGFREAIRIYEEILRLPEHPNLVDAYANLGSVLTQATRNDDAEVALKKALALNEKARGPDDTLVGNDHANLGRLYFRNGDCERAKQEFRKALDIYALNVRNRRLPKDHPYIQEARDWLARPCP